MAGEAAKGKRAPCLALLLVMLMVLLHTTCCGAIASIMKGNASSPNYHARMDEPADWMFDSEITRMLIDSKNYVTVGSKKQNQASVPCGRGKPYKPCIPEPNPGPKKGEKCGHGTYNRDCKP